MPYDHNLAEEQLEQLRIDYRQAAILAHNLNNDTLKRPHYLAAKNFLEKTIPCLPPEEIYSYLAEKAPPAVAQRLWKSENLTLELAHHLLDIFIDRDEAEVPQLAAMQ